MDPITIGMLGSALIGGGASIFGSMMNTSSAQAINQQQMNFAGAQATGAFLPQYYSNLVKGAQGAGINPLAVLGSSSGAGLNLTVPQPGSGVAGAGQSAAEALRQYAMNVPQMRLQKLQEQKLISETQGQDLANVAQRIENAQKASGSVPAKGVGQLAGMLGHKPAWPFDVIDDAVGLMHGMPQVFSQAGSDYDKYLAGVQPWLRW